MEAVISIINSISKTSELINPICLVCSNNVLIEELLLTLEAIIRCSVQIKLVASALCGESKTVSSSSCDRHRPDLTCPRHRLT
jgi:hypothetical protein